MAKILGISAFYHDAAAALIIDNKIIAAAQEERFTRKKHIADFPEQAIAYCLKEGGLDIESLDAIVFYDKPFLKFERLLETYYAFAPKGLISFLKAIPVWVKEKMFLKKLIYDGLKKVGTYNKKELKLLFSDHHLSHAASAFYASNYERAAILTIDGVGEWSTASIGIGEGNSIKIEKELHFPHSVGLLYSAFTYFLGFKVNSGEYKLMGLAPYGNPSAEQTERFKETIKTHLVDIKPNGSIWLNQAYFAYATGLRMAKDKKWQSLFGFARRRPDETLEQQHCNLALAIQQVTEEIVLNMAKEAKRISQSDHLCLAGGVALNCVANGKLLKAGIFDHLYVQPASGDAGGALGAALAVNHMYFEEENRPGDSLDLMQGSYLGPGFSEEDIATLTNTGAVSEWFEPNALYEDIARRIANGQVVGWFQGRMEFGPRALGNRSILANPTNPEMQKKLNLKIKKREGFRPFAPAVLSEDVTTYFDLDTDSPYMTLVAPVAKNKRHELPSDYQQLPMWEKLYHQRSELQSITHTDFSSRIQTVHKSTNPRFWSLINAFKQQTGVPVLINTSFNVRGEPIVCTPMDAYRCFMNTEMDVLVIGNHVYEKTKQPDYQNAEKWSAQFAAD